MQNRTDVERDCLVGTPVPSQVELGCLTVAADLQLDEVTVRGGAQQAYLKAVAGQRCLDRFEHAAGTAGLRREQVHVLGRPAEQAVRGQGVAAGQGEASVCGGGQRELGDARLESLDRHGGVNSYSWGTCGPVLARASVGCSACHAARTTRGRYSSGHNRVSSAPSSHCCTSEGHIASSSTSW